MPNFQLVLAFIFLVIAVANLHNLGFWIAVAFALFVTGLPFVCFSIGCCFVAGGKWSQAVFFLELAYPFFKLLSPLSQGLTLKALESAFWISFCYCLEDRTEDFAAALSRSVAMMDTLENDWKERDELLSLSGILLQQSVRFYLNGERAISQRCAEKGLEIASKQLSAPPMLLAQAHCAVGKFLSADGEHEKAQEHLLRALKTFDSLRELTVEDRALAYLYLAKTDIVQGWALRAYERLTMALALLETSEYKENYLALILKANVMRDMCNADHISAAKDITLPLYGELIPFVLPGGDLCRLPLFFDAIVKSSVVLTISFCFTVLGHKNLAESLLARVTGLWQPLRSEWATLDFERANAELLSSSGKFLEARTHMESLIEFMETGRLEHTIDLARHMTLLAQLQALLGNFAQVDILKDRIVPLIDRDSLKSAKDGDRKLIEIYCGLGDAYESSGLLQLSESFYREAYVLMVSLEGKESGREISNLGISLRLVMIQFSGASEGEQLLNSAREKIRAVQRWWMPDNYAVSLAFHYGKFFLQQGKLDDAARSLRKAEGALKWTPWVGPMRRSEIFNAIAKLNWQKKDYARAEKYFQKAREMMCSYAGPEHPLTAKIDLDTSHMFRDAGDVVQANLFEERTQKVFAHRDTELSAKARVPEMPNLVIYSSQNFPPDGTHRHQ